MVDEENQDENATTEPVAQFAPVSVPLPVSQVSEVLLGEAVLNPPLVIPAEDMPPVQEKSVNVIDTMPLETSAPTPVPGLAGASPIGEPVSPGRPGAGPGSPRVRPPPGGGGPGGAPR